MSFSLTTEPVYHVHVPTQPSAVNGEGILKFTSRGSVSVISPATSLPMTDVSLKDLRRIGTMLLNNRDIIWLETCKSCKNSSEPNQFFFFVVASGYVALQSLIQELKIATEKTSGVFLILEETTNTEVAYISKNHYGCPSYPAMARNRILCGGLAPSSPSPISIADTIRRPSEPVMNVGVSLEEIATKPSRRGTISSITSPTTPYPPNRPFLSRGPTSLDRFRKPSMSSLSSQNSLEISDEAHTPLSDGVFETPTSPCKRKLSQKDSLTSHGSTGSNGSSPPIPEDPREDEVIVEISEMRRLSKSRPDLYRPNVPPRSAASLKMRAVTPPSL